MTSRTLWTIAVFILFPGFSFAQTMEPTKMLEVGDKASYAWKNHAKSETMTQEVVEVNGSEIIMVETRGAKSVDRIYAINQGGFKKEMCWAVSELCAYAAPQRMTVFPLKKGKKWTNSQTVQGETFKADLSKKHKVGRLEKVKVPAGEYEAFRIKFSGRVKGENFQFTEKATYWYALVNGKPIMVKLQYSNGNRDKVTMELVSLSYQ
jgi:hypothetical protein